MKYCLDCKRNFKLIARGWVFVLASPVMAQDGAGMKEGDRLFSKGQYAESAVAFTRVIEADPENINAQIQRGMAYSLSKNYEKAIDDFSRVLVKKPELMAVRNSRGSAWMKLKKYNQAIEDYNAILSADPENQEAYNNRGWCKKHLGDEAGACDDWKKSKKLGNAEARIILKNSGC